MEEKYFVGEMYDPCPGDKLKPMELWQALEKAQRRSECFEKTVIAVWNNEDRVVSIFLDGDQFAPM